MDFGSIEIEFCPQCKYCCTNIPTLLCGYPILKAINEHKLDMNIEMNFCIYSYPTDIFSDSTRNWQHNLDPRIIQNMTLPSKNEYRVLSIIKTRGKCPFLNPDGCKYPSLKPNYCAQFPFFKNLNKWDIASWCLHSNKLSIDEYFPRLEADYNILMKYYQSHKRQYFELLNDLAERYHWSIIFFK